MHGEVQGLEPFVQSVRSTIAGAGGLRIDHVMGLFRLWWVPDGSGPQDGCYVRYPADDLLDIVCLESHRARAVVVGEDLGTVEDGVAEALAERGILAGPGHFYGSHFPQHVRFSLTATDERIAEAARRLADS